MTRVCLIKVERANTGGAVVPVPDSEINHVKPNLAASASFLGDVATDSTVQ
jgi:hypothetical protein